MKTVNAVYECDTCKRKAWFSVAASGAGLLPKCNITNNCLGIMRKVLVHKDVISTPSIPTNVPGVEDWYPRKVFYEKDVTIKSNTWNITHDMGALPKVYVYTTKEIVDNDINSITHELLSNDEYTISYIDEDTLQITFDNNQQFEGIVQCVSNDAQNTQFKTKQASQLSSTNNTNVSTNIGEITVAVKSQDPISIVFVNNEGNINPLVPVAYQFAKPSQNSPWYGVDNIYINGNEYLVASFNITQNASAKPFFDVNLIDNGVGFYFDNTVHTSLILLLSSTPHTINDRDYDHYIDSKKVSSDNISLTLTDGVVVINSDYVLPVFPKIIEV